VAEQISLAKKMAKESQAKPLASRQINEFLAVYNQELVKGLSEEVRFDLSLRFARESPVFIPSYLESAIKVIQEKVVSNPQLLEKYLSGVSSREREDYQDKLLVQLIFLQYQDNGLAVNLERIPLVKADFEGLLNNSGSKDVSYLGRQPEVFRIDLNRDLKYLHYWVKAQVISGRSIPEIFSGIPAEFFNGNPVYVSCKDIQRFKQNTRELTEDKYKAWLKDIQAFYAKQGAEAVEVKLNSVKSSLMAS